VLVNVYVELETVLDVIPGTTAIARTVVVAASTIAPENTGELVVGMDPSVV